MIGPDTTWCSDYDYNDPISANAFFFPTPVNGSWAESQTGLARLLASLIWIIMEGG